MAKRRLRWRVVAAVAALAVLVSIVAIGLSGGGQSSGSAGTVPTTGAGSGGAAGSDGSAVTGGAAGAGGTVPATGAAPTTVTGSAPRAADVAAARACEAFTVYLDDAQKGRIPAAAGRTLTEDVAVVLQGAQQDQAAGRALPPWAGLGEDLLAAAEDVVSHKATALNTDGAAAGAQCRTVPAAAARAGGFVRTG